MTGANTNTEEQAMEQNEGYEDTWKKHVEALAMRNKIINK